jgi:hypothetical protein
MAKKVVEHECFTAWAVQITMDNDGRKAWAGRYYFTRDALPVSLEGCQKALFMTRDLARKAAKGVHDIHQPACAVKVEVQVTRVS